jgi:hypothetical protein
MSIPTKALQKTLKRLKSWDHEEKGASELKGKARVKVAMTVGKNY